MKLQTSLKVAAGLAALLVLTSAAAHAQVASTADWSAGLVGQTYTGAEYDYTHRTTGPSRAVHHYGFVSNLPLSELKNTDGAFRYGYTRDSFDGVLRHQHEVMMAFTHWIPQGDNKLFVEGDAGWAWIREGGVSRTNGFAWRAVAGVEVPVAPRVVLTPYVSYKETSRIDAHAWNFGGRISRRFDQDWSGSAGLAFDDHRNVVWSAALQRRF